MPEVYRLADVFVLPSLTEGFGVVLLEAMATGIPVVTQADPVRDWVLGDSGLLVECAEEGALTDALASLVSDPPERQRVGARGLERVRSTFAWDVLLPQYLSFFAEVADRDFKLRSCYD